MKAFNNPYPGRNTTPVKQTDPVGNLSARNREVALNNLKAGLLSRFRFEFADVDGEMLKRAVNEADALATLNGLPHLLLPVLAEEKVQAFRQWGIRQAAIQNATLQSPTLAFAA